MMPARITGAAFSPPIRYQIERILRYENDVRLHAVYTALERHLSAGGQNMLSYAQIAELTIGVSPATVRRKMPRLIALGLISRHRKGRGAYCWALIHPPRTKIMPFQDVKLSARDTTMSARALTMHTNMMNDDDNNSIEVSDNSLNALREQTILTPQRAHILQHIPDADLPLLRLADDLPLDVVKKLVEKSCKRGVIDPPAFLMTCIQSRINRPKSQPQDNKNQEPRKLGGKYADWIET